MDTTEEPRGHVAGATAAEGGAGPDGLDERLLDDVGGGLARLDGRRQRPPGVAVHLGLQAAQQTGPGVVVAGLALFEEGGRLGGRGVGHGSAP